MFKKGLYAKASIPSLPVPRDHAGIEVILHSARDCPLCSCLGHCFVSRAATRSARISVHAQV